MNTRFISASRASAGYQSVLLVVAATSLISMPPPVLAQNHTHSTNMAAASRVSAISQETLDGLLAPIALYPDPLLAQVLRASTFPVDVLEAARWQREHPDSVELSLQGVLLLQDDLALFDWDPSVKSLVGVPQVLQHMGDSPRWMQALGRAVLDDQARVMASVQALRQKARDAGTLTSNDKQTVNIGADAANGVEYISIAPASPQTIYVPVYDPYVAYGTWWWPSRPVYWGLPVGVALTSGYFWGPRYYHPSPLFWGGFNWGTGVMIHAPIYRPHHRMPPRGSRTLRPRNHSHPKHRR